MKSQSYNEITYAACLRQVIVQGAGSHEPEQAGVAAEAMEAQASAIATKAAMNFMFELFRIEKICGCRQFSEESVCSKLYSSYTLFESVAHCFYFHRNTSEVPESVGRYQIVRYRLALSITCILMG
jgi:hypothetical protein